MSGRRSLLIAALCLSLVLPAAARLQASPQNKQATAEQLQAIRDYIKRGWRTLTRSNERLAEAAVDPKFKAPGGRWPVYAPRDSVREIESHLRARMPAADFARIDLRPLPDDAGAIREPGLLYLPRPYVVPGGRFNEMYGWDSYFIQVGLLRDGETELAKDMVDNFLYEVDHYGKILNANRTYYLTRSQPPFLTEMVLGVYYKTGDREWLRAALPRVLKYYRFWAVEPHLTPRTGLSRYFDLGSGPAPEVLSDERDAEGRTHYDRVKEFYRTHEVKDYNVGLYYDRKKDQLTPLFYKGDRSMRESGFDPSNRFGPFSVDIINYNPVCLNSLLYVMETQMAEMMKILDQMPNAAAWSARAERRRQRINSLMWDERDGLYYDYNFKTRRVRRYPFVTTFYPLWAGIATRRQAGKLVANLRLFERAGGLLTSTNESGSQWDAPFGWAPMQMIAIKGLRRYGYTREADRVTISFLSMVLKDFIEHNTIVEKYDVVRRRSDVKEGIKFGYNANQVGFGWTNAAFVELYADMGESDK